MLDKVKEYLMAVLLKRYALGVVVKGWDLADGYRTQISMASAIAVLVAGYLGYMPIDKAHESALLLGGSSIATFLEKLRKHEGLITRVGDMAKEVREERKPIDGPANPL
jgi:hypothetical protein